MPNNQLASETLNSPNLESSVKKNLKSSSRKRNSVSGSYYIDSIKKFLSSPSKPISHELDQNDSFISNQQNNNFPGYSEHAEFNHNSSIWYKQLLENITHEQIAKNNEQLFKELEIERQQRIQLSLDLTRKYEQHQQRFKSESRMTLLKCFFLLLVVTLSYRIIWLVINLWLKKKQTIPNQQLTKNSTNSKEKKL